MIFDREMKLSRALVELQSLFVGLSEVWISRYEQVQRNEISPSQLKLQEVGKNVTILHCSKISGRLNVSSPPRSVCFQRHKLA